MVFLIFFGMKSDSFIPIWMKLYQTLHPSSGVRHVGARYGLRGVRVGEASQPGPTQALVREIDMTLQDSFDKEPFVRTGSVPPVATMVDQGGLQVRQRGVSHYASHREDDWKTAPCSPV